jgi:hypothetical protein
LGSRGWVSLLRQCPLVWYLLVHVNNFKAMVVGVRRCMLCHRYRQVMDKQLAR